MLPLNLFLVHTISLPKVCEALYYDSTPICMVLGELGRCPIILKMKIRMLGYWNKLLKPFSSEFNCKLYKFLYRLHHEGHFSSPWLLYIEKMLDDTGFCNIWIRQEISESTCLKFNRFACCTEIHCM